MPFVSRREVLLSGLAAAAGPALRPSLAQRLDHAEGLRPSARLRFAVPIPTPFNATLELDLPAHRQLLEFYRRTGATAVLAVSATGEMLSISWPEALVLSRQAVADLSADQQAAVADRVQQFKGWCRDLDVSPLA